MAIRKVFALVFLLVLESAAARGSTITVALGVSLSSSSAASAVAQYFAPGPGGPYYIYIFAETNTLGTASNSSSDGTGGWVDETGSSTDGGIAGFGFTVRDSSAPGSINYASGSGNNTWPQPNMNHISPTRTSDGSGFYAAAASFYGPAGPENYANVTVGTADSPTLVTSGQFAGYDLIATEKYTVSSFPNGVNMMAITVSSPTYYDSTNGSNNFLTNYTNVVSQSAYIIFDPEPAPLSLLGFGIFGLLARRRI